MPKIIKVSPASSPSLYPAMPGFKQFKQPTPAMKIKMEEQQLQYQERNKLRNKRMKAFKKAAMELIEVIL